MEFFKKDTYYLGSIVGIILPVIVYGLVYLIDMMYFNSFGKHMVAHMHYLYLLSVVGNILAFRYFYINAKKYKAGAGILLVTLIVVVLYFINFY
ncbi:MAG: hypothetical protein C0595_04035 [Marinilabiliales bacterium]|nr:MAG: hypothetical protein C0595_04035 [Marinilabiliales bacterium]